MSEDFGHDTTKSLNELRDEACATAKEHGFNDASVGEEICLMHSELSEALEDFRAGKAPNATEYFSSAGDVYGVPVHPNLGSLKPCGIPSEMADVIIRILHFSGKHNIDIEKAVLEKMAYNKTRSFRHGNKKL